MYIAQKMIYIHVDKNLRVRKIISDSKITKRSKYETFISSDNILHVFTIYLDREDGRLNILYSRQN